MPPVFIAIAALLTDIAEVIGVTATLAIFNTVLFVGASLVLGQISKMFSKGASNSSLANQVASRTITSRQAIAPWRVLYGTNRVGGIITFLHTTGTNNEKLHIVITIAGHEVNASSAMYFDGVAVPLDGSGNATGNFAGFVHAEFNSGTKDQASFAGLVAAAPTYWTSAHQQRGRAGWYVQLTWDQNKFPNGVPNITFDVKGRKVYDPRNGTIAFSNNAALCIADYLNNASFGLVAQTKYPLTASMLSASSIDNFNAANLIDGNLGSTGFDTNSPTGVGSTITVDLGSGNAQEFRRFRMYANTAGSIWNWNVNYSDDNITYHAAASAFFPNVLGWSEVELAPNGAHRYWQISAVAMQAGIAVPEIEFYTSDVDSTQLISAANTCDEQVNILPSGTQNRFSIDGSFDTSEVPANVVGRMNSAMAGSVLYAAGKWGVYPGIWRAPTVSLSDADFRGAMTVQTRLTHRDLYNGVKGTFISPTNNWQPADYPPFQDATALQEDANEQLWLDVELPFTIDGAMAQRLSKIALRRVRHQITVQGQFKLTAYQVQPLDVVQLSHPRFGWVNKTFEITACTLAYIDDGNGSIALGVDLTMREADSTIYDWTTADQIALNLPPLTVLPQNSVTQSPTGISVSSVEVKRVVDGIRMNFITVSWTPPADQFVTSGGYIVIQYKKHTDVNWTDIGRQKGNVVTAQVGPVIDGTQYDVQIWAENSSGVQSTATVLSVTPTGTSVTLDTIADGSTYGRTPLGMMGQDGTDLSAQAFQNLVYNGDMSIATPTTGVLSKHASAIRVQDGSPPSTFPSCNGWTRNFESAGAGEGLIYQNNNGAVSWTSCPKILVIQDTATPDCKFAAVCDAFAIRSGVNYRFQAAVFPGYGGTGLGGPNTLPANASWYFRVLWYSLTATDFSRSSADLISFTDIVSGSTASGAQNPQKVLQAPTNAGFCRIAFYHWDTGTAVTTGWNLVVTAVRCTALQTAFDVTPINTSGHSTSSSGALAQSGTTTTINVAASTIQYGDGAISYNSGSVTPGGYGTWYVYADDPTYAGGAVTYVATATESNIYAANGRIFFGKITTAGGGGTVSNNPPGTGGGRSPL